MEGCDGRLLYVMIVLFLKSLVLMSGFWLMG